MQALHNTTRVSDPTLTKLEYQTDNGGTVHSFSDRTLHSRLILSFTPLLRLKRCHACGQWHSSRVATFLPVHTVNCVHTRKGGHQTAILTLNPNPNPNREFCPNTEGQYCFCKKDCVRCSFLNAIVQLRRAIGASPCCCGVKPGHACDQ
jgi:hypothetical protein